MNGKFPKLFIDIKGDYVMPATSRCAGEAIVVQAATLSSASLVISECRSENRSEIRNSRGKHEFYLLDEFGSFGGFCTPETYQSITVIAALAGFPGLEPLASEIRAMKNPTMRKAYGITATYKAKPLTLNQFVDALDWLGK